MLTKEIVKEEDANWITLLLFKHSVVVKIEEMLCSKLGLTDVEIMSVRRTCKDDNSGYGFIKSGLIRWIEKCSSSATFEELINALTNLQCNAAAVNLKRELESQNSNTNTPEQIDTESTRYSFSSFFDIPGINNRLHIRSSSEKFQILHASILKQRGGRNTDLTALIGVGGSGKTSFAAEYGAFFQSTFPESSNVIWISGGSSVCLNKSFYRLALELGILKQEKQMISGNKNNIRNKMYQLLNTIPNTLIIIDDVEDYHGIKNFIPEGVQRNNPFFLLTSRHGLRNDRIHIIEAGFTQEESIEYIKNYLCQEIDPNLILRLVQTFELVPLGIRQAGAYIADRAHYYNISIVDAIESYLIDFKKCPYDLLTYNHWAWTGDVYEFTIYSVWQKTFERINNLNPLAWFILQLLSYLTTTDIPVELFQSIRLVNTICYCYKIAKIMNPKNTSNEDSMKTCNIMSAFKLLVDYGIIICTNGGMTVTVNKVLMQYVIRIQNERNSYEKLSECVKLFKIYFQSKDTGCEYDSKCLSQAEKLIEYIKNNGIGHKYKKFIKLYAERNVNVNVYEMI